MDPFFSVIIPTFNGADLISETLDSALAQEFQDFEIIIVNDGSTDDTGVVLEAYSRRYPFRIQIVGQENRGEGGARNSGIQRARGRYIALLDQDDLWYPWTLHTYHEVLRTHDFPAVLIGTGKEFSDPDALCPVEKREVAADRYADYFSTADLSYLPAGTPGTVVRTDEARRVGGLSEDRVVGIDLEFFFKLGEAHGLVHITSPVTIAIRRHSGNLQKNMRMMANGALLLIDREAHDRYPGGNVRKWARRLLLTRFTRTVSVTCLQARLFEETWRMYCRTFTWHLRLGRMKYLVGFPLKFVWEKSLHS